jgi:hypothetical protein
MAAEAMNVSTSVIRSCLANPNKLCRGFTLSYAPYKHYNQRKPHKSFQERLELLEKVIRSDGQIFASRAEAARAVEANPSHLYSAIEDQRKCKGFHFAIFNKDKTLEEYAAIFEQMKNKPRLQEEQRLKARERMLGKTLPPETRQKISEKKKGSKLSLEGKIKRCEKVATKVVRSDGKFYISIGDAASDLGVHRGSITRAIKKQGMCKGYKFMYYKP